jgi:hypothetical protein
MRIFREVGGVLEGESMIRLVYSESLWATGDKDAARAAIADARDGLIARADAMKNLAWRKSFLERVRENISHAGARGGVAAVAFWGSAAQPGQCGVRHTHRATVVEKTH